LEILFKLSEKSVIFFKDAKFPGFPCSHINIITPDRFVRL
jgi:hypothetical protein